MPIVIVKGKSIKIALQTLLRDHFVSVTNAPFHVYPKGLDGIHVHIPLDILAPAEIDLVGEIRKPRSRRFVPSVIRLVPSSTLRPISYSPNTMLTGQWSEPITSG